MQTSQPKNPIQQQSQQGTENGFAMRYAANASGTAGFLKQSGVIDQPKQLYQSQRPLPVTKSNSLDSAAKTQ